LLESLIFFPRPVVQPVATGGRGLIGGLAGLLLCLLCLATLGLLGLFAAFVAVTAYLGKDLREIFHLIFLSKFFQRVFIMH
jgi:hypothetical protein